jgi:calcyclin binding protein
VKKNTYVDQEHYPDDQHENLLKEILHLFASSKRIRMSSAELKIKEYELDIQEYNSLLTQATRSNAKQLLTTQLANLNADLSRLQRNEQERISKLNNNNSAPPVITGGYTKKIDTYGWDQSDKFVKIYITSLADVNKVKQEDIVCNFTLKSFDCTVKNLNKINYNLSVLNLAHKIEPSESYVKVKSDMIAIFLKKSESSSIIRWSSVTEKDSSKNKEKPLPKMDENADPQEGLMSMMKKMYEEGDDEMKRTISKAFTESREKSAKGEKMTDSDMPTMF